METHCKYSISSYLPQFTDVYTCEVIKVAALQKNSFVEEHEAGKNDADVKYLRIKNKTIGAFPRHLVIKFKHLVCLKIDTCRITKICRKDLNGLETLEIFDMSRNLLTSLPDDLFLGMKKLRGICFKSNKLEKVTSKLFEPIAKQLETANFEDNVKIDDRFNIYVEQKNDLKEFIKVIEKNCSDAASQTKEKPKKIAKAACNNNVHKNLLSSLADFKATGEYTDFVIKICGKQFKFRQFVIAEYKIHKCIIAAQSSKFKEIFQSNLHEKTFVEPENFYGKTFESFMDFFYSGVVDDDVSSIEMFELANVFDVPQLKILCISRILESMNESNALQVYSLGHKSASYELIKPAFVLIQKKHPEIKDTLIDDSELVNKIVLAKQAIDDALFAKSLTLGL